VPSLIVGEGSVLSNPRAQVVIQAKLLTDPGGTSTMMGQQERTESLFYYLRLEDQIPQDRLLRLIDQCVDLRFVRERLKPFTVRPVGPRSIPRYCCAFC